ncbi:MAG TPA: helix-turn-helix transcriptional regulator [Chthonomonadaceae bacterium]|nr:helix-turn-helix transcriptional regulator [Chthonomonadaceae bacterium]
MLRAEGIDKKELGLKLRARREYLHLTQQEVADALSMNRVTYAQYETGRNEMAVSDLPRIAKVLQVPISYFFEEERDLAADDQAPTIQAYYDALPPDEQDELIQIARMKWEKKRRRETTHGPKSD